MISHQSRWWWCSVFNVHTLFALTVIAICHFFLSLSNEYILFLEVRKEKIEQTHACRLQTIAKKFQLTNKLLLYKHSTISCMLSLFHVWNFECTMISTVFAISLLLLHCTLYIWSLYCQSANLQNVLWTFKRLYCLTSFESTYWSE